MNVCFALLLLYFCFTAPGFSEEKAPKPLQPGRYLLVMFAQPKTVTDPGPTDKDKEAKDKEAKEKEAKEKEAKDKEAKEKAAREKEAAKTSANAAVKAANAVAEAAAAAASAAAAAASPTPNPAPVPTPTPPPAAGTPAPAAGTRAPDRNPSVPSTPSPIPVAATDPILVVINETKSGDLLISPMKGSGGAIQLLSNGKTAVFSLTTKADVEISEKQKWRVDRSFSFIATLEKAATKMPANTLNGAFTGFSTSSNVGGYQTLTGTFSLYPAY